MVGIKAAFQFINHRLLRISQRIGFNITQNHYYSPIPDLHNLPDAVFDRISELPGIDINEGSQIELTRNLAKLFKHELNFATNRPTQQTSYYWNNRSYQHADAAFLYCMIRYLRPSRVIEVGSGFSTLCAATAIRRNLKDGFSTDFIAIEPFPSAILRAGVPGVSRLIESKIQDIELNFFSTLNSGDILFIDTTHAVKIGGDVNYLYLEVLPRLSMGVYVHTHDIALPKEYPRAWIEAGYFWSEQYLLQAFLTFNNVFEVVWAGSYLHQYHPDVLKELCPVYDGTDWPGAFWIKRKNSIERT